MKTQSTRELIQFAIEEFVTRRIREPEILVAGSRVKRKSLQRLGVDLASSGKMPNLVIHDHARAWLFLMDIAMPSRRMGVVRREELRRRFMPCGMHLILFSGFPDRDRFAQHAEHIAWGTHVWIADEPDHMIHFNGERFLGPYASAS